MAQYFQQQVQEVDSILYKLRCYRDTQRVRTDVIELIKNIPSLQPRAGSLARGPTQSSILFLAGTIPILYSGVQYNIPVNIWIIEAYPFSPPVCYVTPTPGMIIKPKHKHVDSTGMCYLPYLSNWNPNSCNLVGLVGTMSKVFGVDPPVRSQAAPVQTQFYGQQPPAYPQPNVNVNVNVPQTRVNVQQTSPMPGGQPFEDPSIALKRNLTNKMQERIHRFNSASTQEIDTLMATTSELESRGSALAVEQAQIEEDQNRMESDIESLIKSFEDLNKWLEENETANSGINIDVITEPKEVLTKQLLYLVAEEATIEDTLYYLEKKMIAGGLDVDTFLKAVRTLSTEQFQKRATIKKIHEKQRGGR